MQRSSEGPKFCEGRPINTMEIAITNGAINIQNLLVIEKGVFDLAENAVKVRVKIITYLVLKTCESLVHF